MRLEDLLYKTLVKLASTDQLMTAREIAKAIDVPARGEGSPNKVLYGFPRLFRRVDGYIPKWQLSGDLRAATSKVKRTDFFPQAGVAIDAIATRLGPSTATAVALQLDASPSQKTLQCRACQSSIAESSADWGPICSTCYKVGRKALARFADYDVRLPTMKDFRLYEND